MMRHASLRILCGLLGVAIGQAAAESASAEGPLPRTIVESARQIPIAAQADVVVVGGSTAAVAAAVAAAKQGVRVFLAAPRHYLGEDMAGTLRLWLDPGETARSAGAKFRSPAAGPLAVRYIVMAKETRLPSPKRAVRRLDMPVDGGKTRTQKGSLYIQDAAWYEYTLDLQLPGDS